ncbi:MAG: C-terminal binding protein [Betaproteobacteria bacterium AqS2]|uniref:C-terminal binding protein n=1 Tax=Candidatus Amphirhobacter heronislandensis TaxID=1732024 RepID=A0A930Y149_9GAMM|nr:C-terminal binding protein [Betaproteobacteria bacterium AqS2]
MSAAKRAVVTEHAFEDLAAEREAAAACGVELEDCQCKGGEDVVRALAGTDAALVQLIEVPAAAVAGMKEGGTLIRYGVGVDNIDLAACAERGVRVCNVPDYGLGEVADHSVALLLALLRRLPALDAEVRAGGWDLKPALGAAPPLDECVVGTLGFGRIGRAVLRRMRAFGVQVIAHDPVVDPEDMRAEDVAPVELDELFARADAVSLHAPATAATRGLVDAARIVAMKDGALLVNCARGGLVDEEALAAALRAGKLAGAGLDVFGAEPLPAASPLRGAPNLLLTPHAAWCSRASTARLQRLAAEELGRALRGEPLRCEVRPER